MSSALHQLVQDHLGIALPRPLLAEVHQASGGNPFYALEIVRMLQRSDVSIEAGQPLPVPDSLHDLVHGRLLALPPESRDFLLAAAAHAHPTISITERRPVSSASVGLAPASRRVSSSSTGNGSASRTRCLQRARTRRRIRDAGPRSTRGSPELLEDPEARAWQLAASVDEPDEDVATVIEDAADHARKRGALRPAALLLDRAEQLTPSASRDDAVRRAVEAAYLHFESGDCAEGRDESSATSSPPFRRGPVRARALRSGACSALRASRRSEGALRPGHGRGRRRPRNARGRARRRRLLPVSGCSSGSTRRWSTRESPSSSRRARRRGPGRGCRFCSRLAAETLLGRPIARRAERRSGLQRSAEHLRVMDQPLSLSCAGAGPIATSEHV